MCRELFPSLQKINQTRFFGIYLHSLAAHSPIQYELMSQKSVNTEHQERLFGEARMNASHTTNRHPDIISSVLLRIQAKKMTKHVIHSVIEADSKVSKAASHLPPHNGTSFPTNFLQSRLKSWQAHLERISPFLLPGGVWWKKTKTPSAYHFLDGDHDHEQHPGGPPTFSFSINSSCLSTTEGVLEANTT